jgi:chromosome segregation ATPase
MSHHVKLMAEEAREMEELTTAIVPVLIAGAIALTRVLANVSGLDSFLRSALRTKRGEEAAPASPTERLSKLAKNLDDAAQEASSYLQAMVANVHERQEAVRALEAQLAGLEKVEADLSARIKTLNETPLPVAEYFASLSENMSQAGERRSKLRDYVLFFVGAVFSAVSAIVMHKFGWT